MTLENELCLLGRRMFVGLRFLIVGLSLLIVHLGNL